MRWDILQEGREGREGGAEMRAAQIPDEIGAQAALLWKNTEEGGLIL
jgi:hypothetical protein